MFPRGGNNCKIFWILFRLSFRVFNKYFRTEPYLFSLREQIHSPFTLIIIITKLYFIFTLPADGRLISNTNNTNNNHNSDKQFRQLDDEKYKRPAARNFS